MLIRSLLVGVLFLICLGFSGCYPGGEGQLDEQRNPYFLAGKDRVAQRDYKGAIEAFEKALEANPRSPQTHFELGMLYEHSEKEEDYISAMYHYQQAIKLRPNEYPADNARQRIPYCKRELVKAESLAPVAQNLMRELDKLRQENQKLTKQLELISPHPAGRQPLQPRTPPKSNDNVALPGFFPPRPTNNVAFLNRTSPPPPIRERVMPLPPAPAPRTHTVVAGETPSSIARQYHVKLEALMSANPTIDAKRMKIGQIITLPSP